MKKSKKIKLASYMVGQVIRYKHGSVSIVANTRPIYHDVYYNTDAIDMVIDKTTHPVWSAIKKVSRKA